MAIYSRSSDRILIIGGSGSGKINAFLNLIKEQNDIDKISLYWKNLSEPNFELLIKKLEDAGIKHLNDPNAFIKYLNTMDDVYENIDGYNPSRKKINCFWRNDCRHYDK